MRTTRIYVCGLAAAAAMVTSTAAAGPPARRVRIPPNDRWVPAAAGSVALADDADAVAQTVQFRFRPRGPRSLDPARLRDPTQVGRPPRDDARDAYVRRSCLFDPLQSKCR